MKKLLLIFCSIFFLSCVAGGAHAASVLDQTSEGNLSVSYNTASPSYNWQQEVVVGVDGILATIELYLSSTGSLNFYINTGSAWQSDASNFAIASLTFTQTGWVAIDVSSANLLLNAGDVFVIGIQGTGGTAILRGSTGDAYTAGSLYMNGNVYVQPDYDFAFRTYMDTSSGPNPAPEPATLLLLGLGLIGLAGAGRKFRR